MIWQGVPQLLGTGGWRCCSLVLEFQRDSRPEQHSKQAWQQEDKMDAVQFSDASNDWEQTRSSNSTNAAFLANDELERKPTSPFSSDRTWFIKNRAWSLGNRSPGKHLINWRKRNPETKRSSWHKNASTLLSSTILIWMPYLNVFKKVSKLALEVFRPSWDAHLGRLTQMPACSTRFLIGGSTSSAPRDAV